MQCKMHPLGGGFVKTKYRQLFSFLAEAKEVKTHNKGVGWGRVEESHKLFKKGFEAQNGGAHL